MRWVVAAVLVGAACALAFLAWRNPQDNPAPAPALEQTTSVIPIPPPPKVFPPTDWTHNDLADHLAAKGIKVAVTPVLLYSQSGAVAAAFTDESRNRSVMVYLCPDDQIAREEAERMGEGAFAKGRFAIGCPRALTVDEERPFLKQLAAALD